MAIAQGRARRGTARVGAGLGFGQAKGPELLAAGQRGKVAQLLLFVAKEIERTRAKRGMGLHRDANRDIATRNFLDSETVGEEVRARAAVLFGEGQAKQAQFSHLFN